MNKRQTQDRASGMGIDATGTKAEIEARIADAIAAQASDAADAAMESATTDEERATAMDLEATAEEASDDAIEAQEAAMHDEVEGKPTVAQKMTRTLDRYKGGYVTSQTASGTRSQHTGDDLAFALAGSTPSEVAAAAERVLDLGAGFLVSLDFSGKYDALNPGQVRMNSGNRIRAAIKRGDITIDQAITALAA